MIDWTSAMAAQSRSRRIRRHVVQSVGRLYGLLLGRRTSS
jgi:hypothetical protein